MKVGHFHAFAENARRRTCPVFVGTEMNAHVISSWTTSTRPRWPRCTGCPRGALVLHGHTALEAAAGMASSANARHHLPTRGRARPSTPRRRRARPGPRCGAWPGGGPPRRCACCLSGPHGMWYHSDSESRRPRAPEREEVEKYALLRNLLACPCWRRWPLVQGGPPPPPPPPPMGPQTKEEVLALVRPVIAPLRMAVEGSTPMTTRPAPSFCRTCARPSRSTGPRSSAARPCARWGYEIADSAREASADERWKLALFCLDAHDTLSMESVLLGRITSGQKMLSSPPCACAGSWRTGGQDPLRLPGDRGPPHRRGQEGVQAREARSSTACA